MKLNNAGKIFKWVLFLVMVPFSALGAAAAIVVEGFRAGYATAEEILMEIGSSK